MIDSDWLDELSIDARTELATAFKSYQYRQGILDSGDTPSVKKTSEKLNVASELALKLSRLLDDLSPVGKASVFEIAMRQGEEFGRVEISALSMLLQKTADMFSLASDQIKMLHSPAPERGQGSNSSMGKDADILCVRADHGRRLVKLNYNQPKDLFACAALAILYRADAISPPDTRGTAQVTLARLQFIWRQHSNDPLPNWGRVIRDRRIIHRRTRAESDFLRDFLLAIQPSGTQLPKKSEDAPPLLNEDTSSAPI